MFRQKLMVGLHHGNPRMVELEVWLQHRCLDSEQGVSKDGEASVRLYHRSLKVVEFMRVLKMVRLV